MQTEVLSVRVDLATAQELDRRAWQRDTTRSAYARRLIETALQTTPARPARYRQEAR